MTEAEAIERIHSVYPTGSKDGLRNMTELMRRLGDVQNTLSMIHVAGTNGKGSCCAMLERTLREAGYKTGLYTSPYIEIYNERIRINGAPVAGEQLAKLVEAVWPAVESMAADGLRVTEFELGTALAFVAFAREKVDFAIIEVGLGGRLDPTNIITPAVCVITEIGLDHMNYLGGTIGEIALEKAGIMKPGVPVALGPQEKEALHVLTAAAKGKQCRIFDPDAENVRETADGVTFDVRLPEENIRNLTVALRGRHQAENACAALGALSALRQKGVSIPTAAIRRGMAAVRWPGRLERFGNVLLDGAHNDPGAKALAAYLDAFIPPQRTVLLTGMMRDKETEKVTARLAPRVCRVVCAQPKLPRSLEAEALAQQYRAHGKDAVAEPDSRKALALARQLVGHDGTVLVAGSLYLIGEIRTLLRQEKEFSHVI